MPESRVSQKNKDSASLLSAIDCMYVYVSDYIYVLTKTKYFSILMAKLSSLGNCTFVFPLSGSSSANHFVLQLIIFFNHNLKFFKSKSCLHR